MSKLNLNVAIVDEHDNIRKGLRSALSGLNYNLSVFEFSKSQTAIRSLHQHPVDMMIADIFMADINGLELLKEVRNGHKPDIPFIVVTGESNKDEVVKAVDMGADDFLIKPFHKDLVAKKCGSLLEKYFNPTLFLKSLREAESYVHKKLFSEAEPICLELLKENQSTSARLHHCMAEVYLNKKQTDEAIQCLQQAVTINPEYYRSYAKLGDIYLELGNEQRAIRYIEEELRIHPKQLDRLNHIAKLFLKNENPVAAQKYFQMALQIDARDYEAVIWIAKNYLKLSNYEKSEQYFRRASRIEEHAIEPIIGRVDIHKLQKQPDKAINVLNESMKKIHNNSPLFMSRADLKIDSKDYKGAELDLLQAHKLDEMNEGVIRRLISFFLLMKKPHKTIEFYKKLIKIVPADPNLFKELAMLYEKVGKVSESIKLYLKSLTLDEYDAHSYHQIGLLYLRVGHIKKAYSALKKAHKLSPEHPAIRLDYTSVHKKIQGMGLLDKQAS